MQIIRRVSDGRVDHLAVFGHLRCQWFIGDGLRFYQTADIVSTHLPWHPGLKWLGVCIASFRRKRDRLAANVRCL
jgi:hypothetical protein